MPNIRFMTEKSAKNSTPKSKFPLYMSALLSAALAVGYFTGPDVKDFFTDAWQVLTSDNETRIRNWVDQYGWWGPVIIIVAMTAQMFLLVIPTILLMIVAVLAFGPVWGSVISYFAVFIASTVGYWVGNYFGTGLITGLLGEKTFKKVETFLKEYGFWAIAVTRINPFLSNDAISFVAGILKMKYLKFIYATLLGISPLIVLIAIMGDSTHSLKIGLLWGSVVSLVVFIAYVLWDRSRKSRNASAD